MEHPTLRLEGLGYREMNLMAEMLEKLSQGTQCVASNSADPMLSEGLSISWNPNSDLVYVASEDGLCWIVDPNGNLEEWVSCPECGHEDFKTHFTDYELPGELACQECKEIF